jgi:hypothetical protein
MAIKGKSKSRGAKSVSQGPKPAYVPVKTPLLRRRGFWIGVASVLGVALVAGLAIGFVNERNDTRERERVERMASVVDAYRGQVEPVLASLGQPVAPAGFDAFPALAASIAALETGEATDETLEQVVTAAEEAAGAARDARGLLTEIPAADLLRGQDLTREFTLYVVNSQDGFARAMDLYHEAALLTAMAAEAEEGAARDELVDRARGVHDAAEAMFARAYTDYVEAQNAAGVFRPSDTFPVPTGPTGPTAATG